MPNYDKKRTTGRPILLYVVPSLAIFVSLLSVLWGSAAESAVAAQVWGGPTDSESGFRGRVRLVRESSGIIEPVAERTFTMEVVQGEHRVTRELTSGLEGWTEFSFPRRPKEELHLQVRSRGQVLARGAPELPTARWRRAATSLGGPLSFHERAELRARVRVESGVLGVPFESILRLEATVRGKPAAFARLSLEGESLEILSPIPGKLDQDGAATFRVRPLHHVSTLRVELRSDDGALEFEQTLPVVPGSLAMERTARGIVVRSPVNREVAWFTFVTERERLEGGRVALSPRDWGSEGLIPLARIPKDKTGLFLVLSTEADGRSPSTVGFPLSGQDSTFEVWDGFLLDGLPQVLEDQRLRHRRFRLALGSYAALSGMLTLVLFWLRVRRSDMQLEQNLKHAGAEPTTQSRSQMPLLIALLCLFFAFSAVVLWIIAR